MFIYFTRNKLNYEKGQLAPFFILILVVLIIMSLVTVNLSKVASIKTEASNAADAGSLAGGSVMAKTFNIVAQANKQLEVYYAEFMVSTMLSFTIAFIYLGRTLANSCPPFYTALESIAMAIKTNWGLLVSINAYWAATEYFYCKIREMADKGQESAVDVAHQFAFINSGIGAKLKKEQRDTFSDFLKRLEGAQEEHTYSWQDGQARAHSVKSQVRIDELEDYKLRTTVMPYPAETALLGAALVMAYAAKASLAIAYPAHVFCLSCCNPLCEAGCPDCAVCPVACAAAVGATATSLGILSAAAAGLAPAPSVNSSSCADALPWIITWIDDIEHNRLVKVDTWQEHEGADLGLWQARYPKMHSLSWADFRGNGSIYPPELRHDASITKTDQSGRED